MFLLSKKGLRLSLWSLLVVAVALEYLGALEYSRGLLNLLQNDRTPSEERSPITTLKELNQAPFNKKSSLPQSSAFPRVIFVESQRFTAESGRALAHGVWNGNRDQNHKFSDPVASLRSAAPLDGGKEECVPAADWQTRFYPTCNSFHELGFQYTNQREEKTNDKIHNDDDDTVIELLGIGTQVHAWTVKRAGDDNVVVLKTLQLNCKINCEFSQKFYHKQMVDAVSAERLTASPYVLDTYGFCGMSVLSELGKPFKVQESRTTKQRLLFSRHLAQGMADMHGIGGAPNATLVHGDFKQSNVIFSQDGSKLKISDFNKGRFLGWNANANEPCGYSSMRSQCSVAILAPEECLGNVRSEKTDVYHLGGMIFHLLTERMPYAFNNAKDLKERDDQLMKKGKWTPPAIPSKIRDSSDPAIVLMQKAMNQCLRFRPEDRPTAKEVLAILNKKMLDKR